MSAERPGGLSRRARTGQRRGRADRLFDLVRRQRAHFDYRCGFEGLNEADLPVYHVRELSRCGEVLAAYGIKQCTDYPAANATGFRDIELVTGFEAPTTPGIRSIRSLIAVNMSWS